MLVFSAVFSWLIRMLNGSANWLVRRVGVQPQEELRSARSPEELGLLAAYSAKAGALPEETAVLLRRTIRFAEKRAAEAMTPRVDVVGIAATESVQTMLELARQTGKSRFPVYVDTVDSIVGVVTVIDAFGVPVSARATTAVGTVAREPVLVPESLDLDGVLAMLQQANADVAIVVDEYGGTDGLVTIEDLVEELVGDIADEHDAVEPILSTLAPLPVVDAEMEAAVRSRRHRRRRGHGVIWRAGPGLSTACFARTNSSMSPVSDCRRGRTRRSPDSSWPDSATFQWPASRWWRPAGSSQ